MRNELRKYIGYDMIEIMRHYSLFDQLIIKLENLQCSNSTECSSNIDEKHSAALMRVNHSGEVSAQALYLGQALVARDPNLEKKLNQAAEEEKLHLEWCEDRIKELNGKTSVLNPIWAVGSFGIGCVAGLMGDKISLGFLAETEYQVVQHIDKHLEHLPKNDLKSREILKKMREDELRHATHAEQAGGVLFPSLIRKLMSAISKIMTRTAYYF